AGGVHRAARGAPGGPGPPQPSRPGAGERRQLTVVSCRLIGVGGSDHVDPEDLHAAVARAHAVCAAIARRFEGSISRQFGDALLVYFGYPQAHEDDAARPIRAGLAIVQDLARLDAGPAAQVGIDTGMMVMGGPEGEGDGNPLGLGNAPHVAAQIQALAAPGTVLTSAATFRLAEAHF